MVYGLLGERLPHSHSPLIHKMLGNGEYTLFEKSADSLCDFFNVRSFDAINVTIPYKREAMKYCDFLDSVALETMAVNTIVNCGGKLFGTNTDIDGFIFMCKRSNIDVRGKKALILGSGGTSHTVTAALKRLGASDIKVVSRSGELNYENVYENALAAQIIVNTTPLGMYPNSDGKPIELSRFKELCGVLDVVYNPLCTKLILEARELEIPCSGGLAMLVAQAAFADYCFRGIRHSDTEIVNIIRTLEHSLQNIVLIGMPGCGKSTVGKLLADKLKRELYDIDKIIVAREKKSIPDIFSEHGEEYFRTLESEVIKELSQKGSAIIACGGGSPLRKENRTELSKNGRIFYIKRELSSLAKDGRPLSSGEGALERLYGERSPIYESFADSVIEPCESALECAAKIIKEFEK